MTFPHRPKITFIIRDQEQADDINTWMNRRDEIDPETRIEVLDQTYVRQELHELAQERHASGTLTDPDKFERMADKVIALAQYAGIYASLSRMSGSEAALDATLEQARATSM